MQGCFWTDVSGLQLLMVNELRICGFIGNGSGENVR